MRWLLSVFFSLLCQQAEFIVFSLLYRNVYYSGIGEIAGVFNTSTYLEKG